MHILGSPAPDPQVNRAMRQGFEQEVARRLALVRWSRLEGTHSSRRRLTRVNQVRSNAAGPPEANAEWLRVSVMGRQAEYASHLVKGQCVLVAGRLQITRFQRQDGSPRVGFDVWADEVQNAGVRAADSDDSCVAVAAGLADPADDSPESDLAF